MILSIFMVQAAEFGTNHTKAMSMPPPPTRDHPSDRGPLLYGTMGGCRGRWLPYLLVCCSRLYTVTLPLGNRSTSRNQTLVRNLTWAMMFNLIGKKKLCVCDVTRHLRQFAVSVFRRCGVLLCNWNAFSFLCPSDGGMPILESESSSPELEAAADGRRHIKLWVCTVAACEAECVRHQLGIHIPCFHVSCNVLSFVQCATDSRLSAASDQLQEWGLCGQWRSVRTAVGKKHAALNGTASLLQWEVRGL